MGQFIRVVENELMSEFIGKVGKVVSKDLSAINGVQYVEVDIPEETDTVLLLRTEYEIIEQDDEAVAEWVSARLAR